MCVLALERQLACQRQPRFIFGTADSAGGRWRDRDGGMCFENSVAGFVCVGRDGLRKGNPLMV